MGGMDALVAVRVGRRAAVMDGGVRLRVLVAVLGGSSGRSPWCGLRAHLPCSVMQGRTMHFP